MNRQLHTQEDLHADRKYKDRLFRLVFSDKKDLLDLYNAVNGTDYDNPEELEVNTLENVLYLSMKNDLSFLDHPDIITRCLYFRQDMRGENHRTFLGNLFNQMPNLHDLIRVQPVGRLIQHDKCRVVNNRLGYPQTLLIPSR